MSRNETLGNISNKHSGAIGPAVLSVRPSLSLPQSSYSQLLAATCLTKLVSRTNNPLPLEQRIDIREYARVQLNVSSIQGVSPQSLGPSTITSDDA